MSNKVSPLLPGSENAAEAQAQKKQERIKAMRQKQKMQEASKICNEDIMQYGLIWEKVLQEQGAALEELEGVVATLKGTMPDPKTLRQPPMEDAPDPTDSDYLELLKMEFEAVDERIFAEAAAAAAAQGLEFHPGPPKKDERALEKADLAYGNDYALLKDLRRASIVCPDIASMVRLIKHMADGKASGLSLVRVKNRFDRKFKAKDESAGYRDIQFSVLTAQGLIWELQVHLVDIEELKTKLRDQADSSGRTGHQRYVAYRQIKERLDVAGGGGG